MQNLETCLWSFKTNDFDYAANFEITQNQTVAIVGKSGSGKSTIANLISRFYSDYSGEIAIDDVSILDYQLAHLRQSISIVNQSPTLFNDSIEKNIAYGENNIDQTKLNEAAEISGCNEFISKLPEGFKSEIGDAPQTFSLKGKYNLILAEGPPSMLMLGPAADFLGLVI